MTYSNLHRFGRFCVVGSSGVIVDMFCLYAFVHWLGWNALVGKVCAAEIAIGSNFILNELWTFRATHSETNSVAGMASRFLRFNLICFIGIIFSVIMIHLLHVRLGLNLYFVNLFAIGLVTLWNFGMNARFNWRIESPS
jgi:dolichol-phosphate mannosyltransferase